VCVSRLKFWWSWNQLKADISAVANSTKSKNSLPLGWEKAVNEITNFKDYLLT